MNNKTGINSETMGNQAQILSFCNQKGGTGKTTSCLAVASILAKQFKVLVVDLDPQAHASYGLNVSLTADEPSV